MPPVSHFGVVLEFWFKDIQRIIVNAVKWAQPVERNRPVYGNAQPLEKILAKVN